MASRAEIEIVLSNGQQAGKTINELTATATKLSREIKRLEIGSEDWIRASEDFKVVQERLAAYRKEAFQATKVQEELTDEMIQAARAAEEMAKKAESLQREIEQTAEAQGFLNNTLSDLIPFKAQYQEFNKIVTASNTAFLRGAGGAKIFKIAIAATGIGLLIVAVTTLVTWLTKTQKGMDFVGKATSAVGAAFQVVIDRVLTFATAMADLFSGNWSAAVEGLTKTFTGFGEELTKETSAAYEMEGAMQDIVRAEKQLELQRSRSRAELERLKMVVEDQTRSDQERLNAAQTAFNLENKLLADTISLQEKKLGIIKAQNAQGTSTDEDFNREYDTEIELNNLREESFTKQTELQNKINELKRAGAVETKELAKEEFLVVSENLEKEIALLDGQIAKEVESRKKAEEEKAKLREEAIAGRMEQLDREYEMEQMKLDQLFFEGQITEEERRQMAFDQERAFLQQRLTEMALLGETEVAQYQEIYTRLAELQYNHELEKTKVTEENEAKRKELMTQGLSAAAGVFAGLATLLSENAKARKKNFAVLKAVQAAEIAANTTTEISNIWKNVSAFPEPFATVLRVIQTGLAVARGASAIARINATQIQGGESFADGGPVFGKSHRDGGIPFLAGGQRHEMEGGEIILSKGVYQNPALRSAASVINQLGGGRSFALGGPVSAPVRGGFGSTSTSPAASTGSSALLDTRNIEALMQEEVQLLRVIAAKPVLALTDIKDGLETLYDVENDATF